MFIVDNHMRRKCIFGGAHSPNMEVMHIGDVLHLTHGLCHLVNLDSFWNAVQGQSHTVVEQFPCADEDDHGNNNTNYRVDDKPARVLDHDAAYHHSYANQSVSCHVEEGTADIEVPFLSSHEEQGRQTINKDTHAGSP